MYGHLHEQFNNTSEKIADSGFGTFWKWTAVIAYCGKSIITASWSPLFTTRSPERVANVISDELLPVIADIHSAQRSSIEGFINLRYVRRFFGDNQQ